ncbi:hypothetical protein EKG37_01845 [Robertmurraya yapensis]|uniref:Uncharacterized protein n=1 Tax=Bacillus yapensis TaxID=2492960 RepID=A0A431WLK9_9BACI|nr:hypothetical protein [Bacillus yapensis]RTR36323.1 hypothetical protein EKG37_01845 [Bacillus yapensis]TKT05826.1 hypothetical protein FAR12_01845 [Bacillus yapensis]
MNKKKFSIITWSYVGVVVLIFGIYLARNMDENWEINLDGQRGNMYTFLGLIFIACILTAVDFAGINEKSNKKTKSTIYVGLSVAAFFLIWRAATALV